MRPEKVSAHTLSSLAQFLRGREFSTLLQGEAEVSGVCLDSRRIQPGDLYVALAGERFHGLDFIDQAFARGAVAVATGQESGVGIASDLPALLVANPRECLGVLAAKVYGLPATKLRTVGITGTQGKTTTAQLLHSLWNGTGVRAGVIGTLGTQIGFDTIKTALTTPEAPDLHGLFAAMVERGVQACAMEVSSHALAKGRVDGVAFDVAVFTNLGRDHLDFHGSMEAYFEAKAQLFTGDRSQRALVNADDPYGRRLLSHGQLPTLSFGTQAWADYQILNPRPASHGCLFELRLPSGKLLPVALPLAGEFNIWNATAALSAAVELGGDPEELVTALRAVPKVPGRLEQVGDAETSVLVDYAHKPDAIAAVLHSVRSSISGKIVLVLGAGGDRDPGKRVEMGRVAATGADIVVVTDDNPRSEDPNKIRAQIISGADSLPAQIVEIADRRMAIRHALQMASPKDVVIIAGKGHESGQERQGEVTPFDDRVVAREELRLRHHK
jgi:UDP-N-acetylmuramoyl-L-alanyl-D-glutamate--2,6-diaminopimelate ligase